MLRRLPTAVRVKTLTVLAGGCGRDAVLEVGVEELVRVQLGRVTGQIKASIFSQSRPLP